MPDAIDKFKPNPQIVSFDYDETLPDEELVFDIFKKLVLARKMQDLTFIAIGKLLKVIRDKKLYKYLDFEDFSQFLASEEVSFSREKAYLYIRTYELYVGHLELDPEELSKVGVARLMMLAPIIKETHSREEAVTKMKEMEGLRYGDFVRQVKQETNTEGQPEVFFSKETGKWFVAFFADITVLNDLGSFKKDE